MRDLLDRYGALLQEVDGWFAGCVQSHRDQISCMQGCSECCRGLFDITLLDAIFLRSGLDRLPQDIRRKIVLKSRKRIDKLTTRWPELQPPWILNHIPESIWDEIMPEDDETPCPLLSDEGACLLYAHRPMTCRLNGIPLIDISGEELFDEWCTLNFTDCYPMSLEDIRYPFNDLFAQELLLFRELTHRFFGEPVNELDTIIPAALLLDAEMLKVLKGNMVLNVA